MARRLVFLAVAAAWLLAACGSAPSQPTPSASAIAAPSTSTSLPTSVPTAAPSATAVPTSVPTEPPPPAPAATATPLPELAIAEQGFRVWCLPEGVSAAASDKIEAPQYARVGTFVNYLKAVKVTVPASACTLAYTFNRPAPKGVQLEAYYFYGGKPWLTDELAPAPDNPAVGYLTLTQPYVINPPTWTVNYRFIIKQDGKELRTDVVAFSKQVQRCWEGSMPDPVTLRCPASDAREPEPKPGVTPSSPDAVK